MDTLYNSMNSQFCWDCHGQVYSDSIACYSTGMNRMECIQQVYNGHGVHVPSLANDAFIASAVRNQIPQAGSRYHADWGNEACCMHTCCRRDCRPFYGRNSSMSREMKMTCEPRQDGQMGQMHVSHCSTDGSVLRGTNLHAIRSMTNQDYRRDCHYRQAYPISTVQYAGTSGVGYVQERYCRQGCTVDFKNDASGSDALRKERPRAADAVSNKGEADWSNKAFYRTSSCSHDRGSSDGSNTSTSMAITDESRLNGEVRKRIDQMDCIPHVPKINSRIPSADEATSDHERLLNRLELYDLHEHKISGDGNCQFRALSDQLYRTSEYHKEVRQQIVDQLKANPDLYASYVPMPYNEYLTKISTLGEWGDHVTLQAAADWYGVRIFVLTSFRDTCYIEIIPRQQKSERVFFLSFWAEVHYNSIYRIEESCIHIQEPDRKKKWWNLMAQIQKK